MGKNFKNNLFPGNEPQTKKDLQAAKDEVEVVSFYKNQSKFASSGNKACSMLSCGDITKVFTKLYEVVCASI